MAIPANTVNTFTTIGNREDLTNMIYRIDPVDTPFISGVDKNTATAIKHEWQTQGLATANASNAQLEGDDVTADAATLTVRLNNICQISRKAPFVSGSQQAVQHAGRDDEMAYQEMLKGLELKRDMEAVLTANAAPVTGNTTTARQLAPVVSWLVSNTAFGAGGANPTSGTTARTDGTQRGFTEQLLKGVLNSAWTNGGKPDVVMVGAFNKQQFSTFTGRSSPIEQATSKKITASVDAYESDFGKLSVVANRFSRSRDALVLQMDMWAVSYLKGRRMVSIPLARTGDALKKVVVSEYTLEARNEKASGAVYDLTTS